MRHMCAGPLVATVWVRSTGTGAKSRKPYFVLAVVASAKCAKYLHPDSSNPRAGLHTQRLNARAETPPWGLPFSTGAGVQDPISVATDAMMGAILCNMCAGLSCADVSNSVFVCAYSRVTTVCGACGSLRAGKLPYLLAQVAMKCRQPSLQSLPEDAHEPRQHIVHDHLPGRLASGRPPPTRHIHARSG